MAESDHSAGQVREQLPPEPNIAMALALLYKHLGGWLVIDSKGIRRFGRPCPSLSDELPQLAGAEADERFHTRDEWLGAIKFIEALLRQLDDSDAEFVFGAMASTWIDDRQFRPSIEEPRRGVRL